MTSNQNALAAEAAEKSKVTAPVFGQLAFAPLAQPNNSSLGNPSSLSSGLPEASSSGIPFGGLNKNLFDSKGSNATTGIGGLAGQNLEYKDGLGGG